ncbi:MAG: hypothetical protein ABL993_02020 [Vicinamibacterales bacterium]
MTWSKLFKRALREDDGQDLVEYGILVALVVVGSVAIFPDIAEQLGRLLSSEVGSWNYAVQQIWIPNCPGTSTPCP